MLSIFCRLLSLALVLCLGVPTANATSTIASPVVNLYVTDTLFAGLGGQIFVAPQAPARPLAFGATFTRASGGPAMDIYLGVIAPGGQVFTWSPKQDGGASLVKGMSPVARANTEVSFATVKAFGTEATYTFSEGDVPGLYSVFMLFVSPGSDPGDARKWTWVYMTPLIFQGLTIQ